MLPALPKVKEASVWSLYQIPFPSPQLPDGGGSNPGFKAVDFIIVVP